MIFSKNTNKTDVNIEVANIIGDVYAIEAAEGQKVFSMLKKAFEENKKVVLSFLNVKIMTTAFLNTAIGELYGVKEFSEEFIKTNLRIENMTDAGKIMLKKVVENATIRYYDPDFYEKLKQTSYILDNN
ncbi:MAG: STAS-like domain-containing protein [Prevotellaceae bacterium]|jgi:hypothetical protein|nr:STAS-like domain-containing protein [Prevotellaceae bacterium]